MLFSAPEFFVFFAAYLLAHFLVPPRYRIYLIIVGSTLFYAWWRLEYVWVPYLLTGIALVGGAWIARGQEKPQRRYRVIVTVIALFLPLAVFKYTDFLYRDVLGAAFGFEGKLLGLPLPLGISFVTFTLTAYIVDSYRGRFSRGQAPKTILAYVLFFPHLIAGPILRPHELIPQLERPRRAMDARFKAGITIFTVGLVKKLVFADQIAPMVDAIYRGDTALDPVTALAAIHGFAVQIYCDFSGYTDMAVGLAMMLGVKLPANFRRPYCAVSLIDFWRRWHITLSTWLRDYLYIPLGGNRKGPSAQMTNLLITMVIGGLWHGANWTFVLWGLVHGAGLVCVHLVRKTRIGFVEAMPRFLSILVTFYFVAFAWILFRAQTIAEAGRIFSGSFDQCCHDPLRFLTENLFPIFLMPVFFLLHPFDDQRLFMWASRRLRGEFLWPAILFCWAIAIATSQGSSAKFIYFDF